MPRRACVATIALALALPATYATTDEAKLVNTLDNSRQELERFFGSLKTVRDAERAEALPVTVTGEGLAMEHHVEESPVHLDMPTTRALAKTLLAVDSYRGGMSACLFDPGVAFRFRRGTASVQVLVCFTCSELVIEEASGRALSGKLSLGAGRAVLLATAKKAFPANKALLATEE